MLAGCRRVHVNMTRVATAAVLHMDLRLPDSVLTLRSGLLGFPLLPVQVDDGRIQQTDEGETPRGWSAHHGGVLTEP